MVSWVALSNVSSGLFINSLGKEWVSMAFRVALSNASSGLNINSLGMVWVSAMFRPGIDLASTASFSSDDGSLSNSCEFQVVRLMVACVPGLWSAGTRLVLIGLAMILLGRSSVDVKI